MPLKTEHLVIGTTALIFFLFVSFPLHTYTYDSLTYVLDVESGRWEQLIHPHHLLYSPLCYSLWQVASVLTSKAAPLAVMQGLGALAAALAFLLLYRILLLWNVDPLTAYASAGIASLSYGHWRFATITEPYALHTFLALALFLVASKIARESLEMDFYLASLAALATLNLQSASLYLPSAILLAHGRRGEWRVLFRRSFSILTIFGMEVIIAYLLFGLLAGREVTEIPSWFFSYGMDQRWWSPEASKLIVAILAASDGVFGRILSATWSKLACLFSALLLIPFAINSLRRSLEKAYPLLWASSLALFIQFAFYYQLDAGSPCYWTIVPFFLAMLLAPLLSHARKRKESRVVTSTLLVLLALSPCTVFFTEILPQSKAENYKGYALARYVERVVSKGTLWTLGGRVEERIFKVFTPLTVRSIHDEIFESNVPLKRKGKALRMLFEKDLEESPVFLYRDLFNGQFQTLRYRDGRAIPRQYFAKIFAGSKIKAIRHGRTIFLWRVISP